MPSLWWTSIIPSPYSFVQAELFLVYLFLVNIFLAAFFDQLGKQAPVESESPEPRPIILSIVHNSSADECNSQIFNRLPCVVLEPFEKPVIHLSSYNTSPRPSMVSIQNINTPINAVNPNVLLILLQGLPEVICVEESWELVIHVHNMDISFSSTSNDCLRVLSIVVPFYLNSQPPVNLQFQADLIIYKPSPCIVSTLYSLQFQFLQSRL